MFMSSIDASYWKPIQSGLLEETDTEFVKKLANVDDHRIIAERWKLNSPMSPHASADIDGVKISLEDFEIPAFSTRHLIVEGAGGIFVPINWKDMMVDLIAKLDLPVLLVARSGLGTLNHSLLTLKILQDRGIHVFALILNGSYHDSNRETLRHFGDISVYEIGEMEELNKKNLKLAFSQLVSLET